VPRSTKALEAATAAYIDTHNADPKPFRWTKTVHDIFASIARYCLRTLDFRPDPMCIGTSDSGHQDGRFMSSSSRRTAPFAPTP
jgi:hypothetical protein